MAKRAAAFVGISRHSHAESGSPGEAGERSDPERDQERLQRALEKIDAVRGRVCGRWPRRLHAEWRISLASIIPSWAVIVRLSSVFHSQGASCDKNDAEQGHEIPAQRSNACLTNSVQKAGAEWGNPTFESRIRLFSWPYATPWLPVSDHSVTILRTASYRVYVCKSDDLREFGHEFLLASWQRVGVNSHGRQLVLVPQTP